MANFLTDTFTAPDATTLLSHTPDAGGAYGAIFGDSPDAQIYNGRLFPETTSGSLVANAATPGSADYAVSVDLVAGIAPGSGNGYYGVAGRLIDGTHFYEARFNANQSSGQIELLRADGTSLGTSPQSVTVGDAYTLTLRMVGDQISALWGPQGGTQSTVVGPVTDSTHAAAGVAGLFFVGASSLGNSWGFDNLKGDTIVSSPLSPGTATASAASATSASVATTAPTGGTGPYSYQLQRAPDSAGSPGTFADVGSAASGQTGSYTWTDSGLTTGNAYWYRVAYSDAASGTATSNQARVVVRVTPRAFVVDGGGSDANDGYTLPWQTTSKVNSYHFIPGDSIRFASGQTFAGGIAIGDSGTHDSPIVVGTTGAGAATLNCTNASDVGVKVVNASHVHVANLTLAGPGVSSTGSGHASAAAGLHLQSNATATGPSYLYGLRASNLTISGFLWGALLECTTGTPPVGATNVAGVAVGFSDLRLSGLTIDSAGRRGILFSDPNSTATSGWAQSFYYTGIYLGNCYVKHVYGDTSDTVHESGTGILPRGVQYGLVQDCTIEDCGGHNGASAGGPAGIYLAFCDSVTLRRVTVARQLSGQSIDGDGIDLDGGVTNCTVESCTTRDCEGAGLMVYANGGLPSTGNVFRNCVSANDARARYAILRANAATRFENCTVYSDASAIGRSPALIGDTSTGGTEASGCVLANCAFVLLNGTTAAVASATALANNLYWFGGTGGFSVTSGGTACASLAALRLAGQETLGGYGLGYDADPGLSAPAAGESCAQLLSAWRTLVAGTLLAGGVDPAALGSTPAAIDPLQAPLSAAEWPLGALTYSAAPGGAAVFAPIGCGFIKGV